MCGHPNSSLAPMGILCGVRPLDLVPNRAGRLIYLDTLLPRAVESLHVKEIRPLAIPQD